MSTHPFISISQQAASSNAVTTSKINAIYMLGVKGTAGTILDNEIREIKTTTDFNAIVGSTALSAPSYRFLRLIDPDVPVFFVNGKDAGATPTLLQNLQAGLVAIGKNLRLKPGMLVSPDSSGLSSADAATFFTSAQNLVSNSLVNWEYYHNLTSSANSKAAAITERNLLSSPMGHSSAWFGFGRDNDNNQIPLCIPAIGKATNFNRNKRGYFAAASYQELLPFKSVDEIYLPKWQIGVNEYNELNAAQINCIFVDSNNAGNLVYNICGARTLATDSAWMFTNTRYAANNIFVRCGEILKRFLFMPTDISVASSSTNFSGVGQQEANVNSDVILTLMNLLDDMSVEGAFSIPPFNSDGSANLPYAIFPERGLNGDLNLRLELFLVQTREKINLNFVKRG